MQNFNRLAVHLAENRVKRTENGYDIGHHATGKHLREDADVAERGRADFQAVGDSPAFAINVESQLALRVFRTEIDFPGGGVDAFGGDNEVVDEFLHLREDRLFVREGGLGVVPVDRTGGQFVEDLAEDGNALADLLKPENKGMLIDILTYHVVSGNVPSGTAVKLTEATALNKKKIKLEVKEGSLFLNTAKVTTADVKCSNGVIHIIDAVLLPPATDKGKGN